MVDTAQVLSYFLLLYKQLKNGQKKYNENKPVSSYTKITNEQKKSLQKAVSKNSIIL